MTLAVTEEPAALDIVLGCSAQLREAVVKEEEDVLQTKIVAVSELRGRTGCSLQPHGRAEGD